MRNIEQYKTISFIISTILLIVMSVVAIITYMNRNMEISGIWGWAIVHHLEIMIILIVIAVFFGFLWSSIFYAEAEKTKRSSKDIMHVLFLFLSREERKILEFLVSKDGETTQADISRIEGMSRVKAFRLIQKMKSMELIDIINHGKVRRIILKENIMNILSENA